jgi:hypothetical protein
MFAQPRNGSVAPAIRQKRHDSAALEIADNGAIPASSPPSPVVDADGAKRPIGPNSAPTHGPQQRVLAHRNCQSFCQCMTWAPTTGKTKLMDDAVHPRGTSPERNRDGRIEPFGEYPSPARRSCASKTPDHDLDLDGAAMGRQIARDRRYRL